MFESAGRLVYRGRWTLLVLSLAAAVLVVPLGFELFGRMADGGFEDPRADSTTAARWNDEWYGRHAPDVVVLYRHPTVKARDPRYKRAVHDSLRALPKEHVRGLATYWTTGSKRMVSKDGRSTYALVTLKGDKQAAYAAIADRLRRVHNLYVEVGGSVPLLKELNDQTAADLARAEAISMPVLLVLLVIVFGSLVAAGLPLLVGLFAVLGALVLLRLLTEVTEVSVFSLNVVTMLGLGLAVDYSLFVLKAFREEIAGGASNEQAVVRTMATAGRTVAFSGLTVATALLGLLLFPQMFLRSIGLGAAAVVLVAMGAALVVLPAVLGILGRHVDALRITPRFGDGRRDGGMWHAVASSVMRRPVLYLVAVSGVLVALSLPFLRVEFGNVDHRVLPAASESRRVAEAVDRDFARNSMAAIDVHVLVERSFTEQPAIPGPLGQGHTGISAVTPVSPSDAKPLADRLRRLPHVAGVDVAGMSQDNGAVRLAVRYDVDPMSDEAEELVRSIRGLAPPEPNVRRVVVGGPTAAQMDLMDSLAATLPWMALVVAAVTAVLLFAAFGSVVLPLKALLMNVLSIGASFGVVVWAFQDGHLASALGFTSTGSIEATVTVLILAVVFGLSMDYEVFLLSRVRAEWLRTGDNAAAVAAGLQQTGGVITSAALLLLVVIGAFSTAGITIVKLLGVGLFVAIVVDATLVRALLVPATMRLMGGANWWLPRPLRAFHRHIDAHDRPAPARALPPTVHAAAAPRPAPARGLPALAHGLPAPASPAPTLPAPAGSAPARPAPAPRPVAPPVGAAGGRRAIEPAAEGGAGPAVTVNGRPAVFGVDTDPVPLAAEHESAPAERGPVRAEGGPVVDPGGHVNGRRQLVQASSFRKHPYSALAESASPEEPEDEDDRPRWVRVTAGRTREVRATPDGAGWMWVEVDS
ncbi:MMPL family transporter [Nonomuraea sp. SYSU D8015]|uniref:MMPL family transporter n=1 Tax=Nonomuraea sp. SYSU D8015 TaxID=2593644 RepID=UPI0016610151|nr:MMPL family transporter [Nonomuraea sp. SYSU D8015]